MIILQSELGSGTRLPTNSGFLNRVPFPISAARVGYPPALVVNAIAVKRNAEKICTADELHYVSVQKSDWRLALWRYLPSPKAEPRNHPLLLLSGLATNAIGYDLSPESSFARFMSGQGFDTWILELRGAGLSAQGMQIGETKQLVDNSCETDSSVGSGNNSGVLSSRLQSAVNPGASPDFKTSLIDGKRTWMFSNPDKSKSASNLLETFTCLSERLSGFLNGGGLSTTIEDFQKQLDLIVNYNWDFDHYLEEDVPVAMEYIRNESKPKDGKMLAVGHSMGGILLYSMLSKCCFEGRDSGLASITTLSSSLDYTSSRSSLKLLLPLAEHAETLNVTIIPIGGLLSAAHPFASYPPYVLSWLTPQISFPDMMHPQLFEKLVLNNFCTVPTKLLLQLTTAFQDGGLRDRNGTFFYKDHVGKSNVPVLALAGDQDLICPPEAVYETVKLFPRHLVTYKVIGEPGGPHYGHYDLVGGRLAVTEVYPCINEFLICHDRT